jgi:hypothetical protein
MAQRAMQPAVNGNGVQFPPEADGVFEVVPVADIAAWRVKLNERFGLGKGDYKSLDDASSAR